MADPTTQHRDRTETDAQADPAAGAGAGFVGRRPGLVSLLTGGGGVVVATLPSLGLLALALAVVALATGVPAMRRGPRSRCFSTARTGVVLGMIAVLLGFVSLAMQLLD